MARMVANDPDWVGVVAHYPDGTLWLFQLDRPEGSIEVKRDIQDTYFTSNEPWAHYVPGAPVAEVNLRGLVLQAERRAGDKPDWAKVKHAIEAAPKQIEE